MNVVVKVDGAVSVEPSADLKVLTQRFRDALKKSVAGIIEAGQVLIEAKSGIEHGQFSDWVVQELRFGNPKPRSREADLRQAEMLMSLARHEVISNPSHWHALPPSIRTLYELTQIKPSQRLVQLIEKGKVHAGTTREEAIAFKPPAKREPKHKREIKLKLKGPVATLVDVCLLLGEADCVLAHIRSLKAERNEPTVKMFDEAVRWAKPKLAAHEGDE
jgi:hypothetical protein